jgi:hypothetical protein
MRLIFQKFSTMLAIYAVALHVILLGFAPIAASGAPTVDPFSVICHSSSSADSVDPAPEKSALVPGHACEHCNLCSTAAPPAAPETGLAGTISPSDVLDVLRPQSAVRHTGISSRPNLPRGPPRFV